MNEPESLLVAYARTLHLRIAGWPGLPQWMYDWVRAIARHEPSETEQMKFVRFLVAEYRDANEIPSPLEIAEKFSETEDHYDDPESIDRPQDFNEYAEVWGDGLDPDQETIDRIMRSNQRSKERWAELMRRSELRAAEILAQTRELYEDVMREAYERSDDDGESIK